jgi:hypothetical protein
VTQILPWLLQRIYKKPGMICNPKRNKLLFHSRYTIAPRFDVLDPGNAAKIAHEFPNKAIVVYISCAVKVHIQETDQFLLSNPFRGAKADMSK